MPETDIVGVAELREHLTPYDAYKDAVDTYFLGMTRQEIATDLGQKHTSDRIVEFIANLGGHDRKINFEDTMHDLDRRPIATPITVEQKLKIIASKEPEFADMLTAAITLQQELHERGVAGEILSDVLRRPFSDDVIGQIAQKEDDAAKIKEVEFHRAEQETRIEISDAVTALNTLLEESLREIADRNIDPDQPEYEDVLRDLHEKFATLRSDDECRSFLNEYSNPYGSLDRKLFLRQAIIASIAIRTLDRRIPHIPNLPRIVRERFVDEILIDRLLKQKSQR